MASKHAKEEETPIAAALQETAIEKLGVRRWDLPGIYRESAEAAIETGLPYWSILVLSGAIATLGLAINSSAVVIGAMLVAPLLAPIVGLALALAVGDVRLAAQAGAVVLVSTLAVALTGAALTAVLPFQTITLEISARARPSTLDLAIAIFSGLVGAVVTVARGSRLSAALPGVAISVALIPPLAVAGFGLAADLNAPLIRGSMLLYGANLAGIVLSGMGVFLLMGMHTDEVIDTAVQWHRETTPRGLAGLVDGIEWVRRLDIQRSPWSHMGLVLAFVVALGIPLTDTLVQITRDARVTGAVSAAAEEFESSGRSSILTREIVYGDDRSRVYLRVATTSWFGEDAREEFERAASAAAGEPVTLVLEQIPVSGGDVQEFARMLPGGGATQPLPAAPMNLTDLVALASARLEELPGAVALPAGVTLVGLELATTADAEATLRATYSADTELPAEAEAMLAGRLGQVLEVPDLRVEVFHLSTAIRELLSPSDTVPLQAIADQLQTARNLEVEVIGQTDADSLEITSTVDALVRMGVDRDRISTATDSRPGLRTRLRPASRSPP